MTGCVHVVDDEAAIRDALAFLFASRGVTARGWPSGQAFLDALPLADCACIILDVRMEGLSGPQTFDGLRARGCAAPVIFLTGHADVPVAVQSLKAGAFDFIEKPFNDNQIVDAVLRAIETETARRLRSDQRQDLDQRLSTLSAREVEVMRLMLRGLLNKQICDALGIAMRTVEVHRSRVLSKMSVRNIAELAVLLRGWE
jgi:two-component system response regulator DctR